MNSDRGLHSAEAFQSAPTFGIAGPSEPDLRNRAARAPEITITETTEMSKQNAMDDPFRLELDVSARSVSNVDPDIVDRLYEAAPRYFSTKRAHARQTFGRRRPRPRRAGCSSAKPLRARRKPRHPGSLRRRRPTHGERVWSLGDRLQR